MNILFCTKKITCGYGGLEVVTVVLANKLSKEGHNVSIFCFEKEDCDLVTRISPDVKLLVGAGYNISKENSIILHNIIIDLHIDVVVNQWGANPFIIYSLSKAKKGTGVKIITVYHSNPGTNVHINTICAEIAETSNFLLQVILQIKKYLFWLITSSIIRYVYRKSDKYMILSNSFIDGFKRFTGLSNVSKLLIMPNPVTIDQADCSSGVNAKKKEVIYVGRINYGDKRTYRVLEVWSLLEKKFPEWKLKIIGDGPDRTDLEDRALHLGLNSVSFEGRKSPVEYYKRASILMLTSDFEGFPLVLPECMSFGVVPVVYGSYSAVYDIIDGNNGLVSEPQFGKFSAENMTDCVSSLMSDEQLLMKMSSAAVKTAEKYSIDTIYQSWMNILNNLVLKEGK